MKATSYNRRQRTNKDTYGGLKNLISDLESKYMDEVATEKAAKDKAEVQSCFRDRVTAVLGMVHG